MEESATMTIYRVRCDLNNYQSLEIADRKIALSRKYYFDCQRSEPDWNPPEVYNPHPKLKRGSFFGFRGSRGGFICDERTRDNDEMAEILEMSGELLPLPYEGETFYVINVLECKNCLDRERSNFDPYPQKYTFHKHRIPDTPLFKIPETSMVEVLCVENGPDPEYEFKRRYERLDLTGLYFEKLWSDEE